MLRPTDLRRLLWWSDRWGQGNRTLKPWRIRLFGMLSASSVSADGGDVPKCSSYRRQCHVTFSRLVLQCLSLLALPKGR